jgi:hypothetical protein
VGDDVQHGSFEVTSPRVDAIPLRDALLLNGGRAETLLASGLAPIPDAVVPSVKGPSDAALASMVATSVEEDSAKPAIWPTVLAAVTFSTHGQQQAVPQGDGEVFVWHGLDALPAGKKPCPSAGAPVR